VDVDVWDAKGQAPHTPTIQPSLHQETSGTQGLKEYAGADANALYMYDVLEVYQ
jgi:hypothetical protein